MVLKYIYNFLIILIFFISHNLESKENLISIASTTSTHDTGLLESINKKFTEKYNIRVNVLSAGTGQAIRIAKDGNVEILLVHHAPSELAFINEGYGKIRHNLMYNDFVIVGPSSDKNQHLSSYRFSFLLELVLVLNFLRSNKNHFK